VRIVCTRVAKLPTRSAVLGRNCSIRVSLILLVSKIRVRVVYSFLCQRSLKKYINNFIIIFVIYFIRLNVELRSQGVTAELTTLNTTITITRNKTSQWYHFIVPLFTSRSSLLIGFDCG